VSKTKTTMWLGFTAAAYNSRLVNL